MAHLSSCFVKTSTLHPQNLGCLWCSPCGNSPRRSLEPQLSWIVKKGPKKQDLPSGNLLQFACENGHLAVGQNLVPLVNIKIAGKWMFIPLKMVLIGIDS